MVTADFFLGGVGKASGLVGVLERLQEAVGEVALVVGLKFQAGFAIEDRIVAVARRGDDQGSAGHRFERVDSHLLMRLWEQEDIGSAEGLGPSRKFTSEGGVLGDLQARGQLAKVRLSRARVDEEEHRIDAIAEQVSDGLHHDFHIIHAGSGLEDQEADWGAGFEGGMSTFLDMDSGPDQVDEGGTGRVALEAVEEHLLNRRGHCDGAALVAEEVCQEVDLWFVQGIGPDHEGHRECASHLFGGFDAAEGDCVDAGRRAAACEALEVVKAASRAE